MATKVMMVDDEIMYINYIRRMLRWKENGFELVATETKPLQAIETFKRLHPDIVLLDIDMPQMTGLTLCKELNKYNDRYKIILLTAYRNFEYAKEAIPLGVTSYLLKHEVTSEILLDVLHHARKQLNQIHVVDEMAKTQLLRELLKRKSCLFDELRAYIGAKPDTLYTLMLAKIDCVFPAPDYAKSVRSQAYSFESLKGPDETGVLNFLDAIEIEDGTFECFISITQSAREYQITQALHHFGQKLQTHFHTFYSRSLSIIISNKFRRFEDMADHHEQMMTASKQTAFEPFDCILFNSLIKDTAPVANHVVEASAAAFKSALKLGQWEAAEQAINDWLYRYESARDYDGMKKACVRILVIFSDTIVRSGATDGTLIMLEREFGKKRWYRAAHIRQYFVKYLQQCIQQMGEIAWGTYSYPVRVALEYIHKHYATDISLNDIAVHTGLGVSTIRNKFKKDTGSTLMDYLTTVRIAQAKKFLNCKKYRICEVAEMTGYHSSQYFSIAFKNEVGVSPTDYLCKEIDNT